MVEAVVLSGCQSTELHLPVATSYKCFHRRWEWNEWLKLPLKYSDLPRNAVLRLSLFDCVGGRRQKLATTEVSLFGKKGIYREGQVDLQMVPITSNESEEDNGMDDNIVCESGVSIGKQPVDVNRLAKLTKKYKSGKIMKYLGM